MKLTSTAFENSENIPTKYTCDGENINPSLEILDLPESVESLVLIVDDPDSPSGDWVHWLVWNIPANTTKIEENSLPEGASQGTTDFGENKYGGPCPHSGVHRYLFKVFALDSLLDLPLDTNKQTLIQEMEGHVVDQAILMGKYERI